MTSLRLSYPATTDVSQITAALRGLLAAGGSSPGLWRRRYVTIEVWGNQSEIIHLVTTTNRDAAIASLTASVPGIRVEPADRLPPTRGMAVGYRILGPTPGVVRTDVSHNASTALLAAMTELRRDEHLVVQWLVGPLVRTSPARRGDHLDRVDRIKRSEAELVASGRIAAWAPDQHRARSLGARLVRVMRQVSGPDGSVRARTSRRAVRDVVAMRPPSFIWPSHLNVSELAAMVGWPAETTPIKGLTRSASRLAPVATGAPTNGPSVGMTTYPGSSVQIRLGTTGRLRHLLVIGPTGVGKTTVLANVVRADIRAGRGVVVFDPLGGLVDAVLEHIPESRLADVVLVDPTDSELPVGLNVLKGADPYRTTDFVVGVMSKMFASSWGPRTADVLRSSLLTLSTSPRSTLADVQDLLTDATFRRRHVARVMDDRVLAAFWTWFESLSDGERSSVIAPVLNKIRSVVLRPEAIRTLCHPDGRLDLQEVFTQRRIVILRLSKGLLGEDTTGLVSGLILARLWQAILGRAAIAPGCRHPVFVYIDELQDHLTLPVSIGDMFAQARGMGVGLVVAHQHLGQLPDRVRRDVLANAGSRVMFQTRAEDAKLLARDLEPHLSPADLRGLAGREIVARVALPDQVLPPVTGRTVPLPEPLSEPAAVRDRSRRMFGRPFPEPEKATRTQPERVGRKPRRAT